MTCPETFTTRAFIAFQGIDLDVQHEPGVDLDSTFPAWCNDEGELIQVNGWMMEDYEAASN